MSDTSNELADRAQVALDEMQHIESTWGSNRATWPPGQAERYERLRTNAGRLTAELEDNLTAAQRREQQIEAIRSSAANSSHNVERTFAPAELDGQRMRHDPWRPGSGDDISRMDTPSGLASRAQDAVEHAHGLPSAAREHLSTVLANDDDPRASALVIAATSDAYRSAFEKLISDEKRGHLLFTPAEREAYARVEHARAALSLTAGNGGVLVPFTLDPSIILTNAGTSNPFRQIARIETTLTDTWNGVTSAGVTAEWLAEGAEAADASPTFARATATPIKGAAWIYASYEIAEDAGTLVAALPGLIADARDRQEATAFALGATDGTNSIEGLITAVTAITASRVSPTTGGQFSAATEVYLPWNALTPRSRKSKSMGWLAHNTTMSRMRQFDTNGGSAFWANLGEDTPERLIGKPIYESSDMVSAVTTGSNILLAGDFNEYLLVDRIGTILTPVDMVMGASNRPTFQKGWAAHYRVGGKVTSVDAFRVLKL